MGVHIARAKQVTLTRAVQSSPQFLPSWVPRTESPSMDACTTFEPSSDFAMSEACSPMTKERTMELLNQLDVLWTASALHVFCWGSPGQFGRVGLQGIRGSDLVFSYAAPIINASAKFAQ